MRRGAKPAKAKVKARLPVARKSRKKAVSRERQLEKLLAEALEQQVATGEILRVISRSPTDVQPVFDAIAANVAQLCGAPDAIIRRVDGDALMLVAHYGALPGMGADYQMPLDRRSIMGRAVVDRQTIHVHDLAAQPEEEFPLGRALAQRFGYRTALATPLLREGISIGSIALRRMEVRPFSDKQIKLLETFANQAVIAIENVRLFRELEVRNRDLTDALEQHTATGEVLKVISYSTFDVQPVFETVAENVVRLCQAESAFIFRFDGELLRSAASYNASPELRRFVERNPMRPGRNSGTARAALERGTVHIPDIQADPEYTYGARDVDQGRASDPQLPLEFAQRRTILGVPMLKGDELLGVIMLFRPEVKPFTDKQIALVETFADQAVIAVENVRLFKELQVRTDELTKSVKQLTALGEISRAVSSTLDLRTVLTTIATRAVELSGTAGGVIYEYDETMQELRLTAAHRMDEELVEVLRVAPLRLGEGATGQAAASRTPIQATDILHGQQYGATRIRSILTRLGFRSVLAVPLLLEQRIVGALTVWRQEAGDFAPETVALLQTLAAQSALAIQNARLFREIEDKSRQLEVASQHKSEFLANMSHELRTPLNAIIGFSEVLSERMFGELNEKQEEYLKDIYTSGQHLLSLINDILDLSKIEAGRMELEVADFDLPAIINNALTLVRERAGRRGIALHQAVDERLGKIRADERKIKQVLLNLLSNAIKFTPEGGWIEVQAAPVDRAVEVAVRDTGVGIAPEDQEAVFEEFRQVGGADKKAEGTGLGLALCRKFIELHGGRIWVTSAVGEGSTFTFALPVHRGE
jgi:signal transduction histidine kinase